MCRLALAGLILAAIPLCPLTSLLGALFGVLALRRIRLAQGRLSGQGVATAAIVVGVIFALLWSAVLDHVGQRQRELQEATMIEAVAAVMQAAEGGDVAGASSVWLSTDEDRPSGQDIARFAAEAADRYGSFDRFMVMSVSRHGPLVRPVVEIAGVYRFAEEGPFGSASFEAELVPGRMMPVFRLTGLMIEDRRRGNLALGRVSGEADSADGP